VGGIAEGRVNPRVGAQGTWRYFVGGRVTRDGAERTLRGPRFAVQPEKTGGPEGKEGMQRMIWSGSFIFGARRWRAHWRTWTSRDRRKGGL